MKFFLRAIIITVSISILVAMPIYIATNKSTSKAAVTPQACTNLGFNNGSWQDMPTTPRTRAQLQQYVQSAVTRPSNGLNITARRQPNGLWTSGRTNTKGTCSYLYGTFAARIFTPVGPGLFPAFWLEDPNQNRYEIDITEQIGQRPNFTYGHAFAPECANLITTDRGCRKDDVFYKETGLAGHWHTYGVIWTPTSVQWTIDGQIYETRYINVRERLFLNLNLAVGGLWAKNPKATTPAVAQMRVAWVHASPVYRPPPSLSSIKSGLAGAAAILAAIVHSQSNGIS